MEHKFERLQPPNVFNLFLEQANKLDSDLEVELKTQNGS